MKSSQFRVIIGVMLLLMGAVALLQNFHVFQFSGSLWGIFWAVVFMAGGAAFLTVLITNRQNWWAVIPGLTLVGLGAIIAISTLFPDFPGNITGAIFLTAIGAAFWVIYFMMPDNWWAIIPGGTLVTLAAVTIASDYNGEFSGGLFFIGLGITFGLLALIPSTKMKWPWIPAGILTVMGLIIAFSSLAGELIWPVALILLGGFFIFRAIRNR
jgi:hypothetical protein